MSEERTQHQPETWLMFDSKSAPTHIHRARSPRLVARLEIFKLDNFINILVILDLKFYPEMSQNERVIKKVNGADELTTLR